MITINEQNYPVLSIHFLGASTVAETEKFLSRFSEWLARQEQFSLILRQTAQENDVVTKEEHSQVHRLISQWAKQNKSQVAQYCIGMAMVMDSPEAFQDQQAKLPKMIETIFGCPGKAFRTPQEAEAWIAQQKV